MKFEELEPGMVLYEKSKTAVPTIAFNIIFKKDAEEVRLVEIDQHDPYYQRWTVELRAITKESWNEPERGWIKSKKSDKRKLFDTLFKEIKILKLRN